MANIYDVNGDEIPVSGGGGEEPFSPVATVTATEDGARISITDKYGTTVADIYNGTATDAQVAEWLEEHPEATTSVQDGSISVAKLSTAVVDALHWLGWGITSPVSIQENPGYFSTTGTISAQSSTNLEVYTQKILVQEGQKVNYSLTYSTTRSMWLVYCYYDSLGNLVGGRNGIVQNVNRQTESGTITVPSGVNYIAFSYRTFGESNIFSVSVEVPHTDKNLVLDNVPADAKATGEIADLAVKMQDQQYTGTKAGYYASNGGWTNQNNTTKEVSTDLIPIYGKTIFSIHLSSSSALNYWCTYNVFDKDMKWFDQFYLRKSNEGDIDHFDAEFVLDSEAVSYINFAYRSYGTAVSGTIIKHNTLTQENILQEGEAALDGIPLFIDTAHNVDFSAASLDNSCWIPGYVSEAYGEVLISYPTSNNEMTNYKLLRVDDTKKYVLSNTASGWTTTQLNIAWFADNTGQKYLGITRPTYTATNSPVITPKIGAKYCLLSSRNMSPSDYYQTATFAEASS